MRGSESIRIEGDELLLDLEDGSTVRATVEGTNSDDPNDLTQSFDGGGWPTWNVEGCDWASVMFYTVGADDPTTEYSKKVTEASDAGGDPARKRQDAPMVVLHPVAVGGPSDQADDVDAIDALLGDKYDVEVADTPDDIEVYGDE